MMLLSALRELLVAAALLTAMIGLVGLVRSLYVQWREHPSVARAQVVHISLWMAAVVSLSQCFAVYRRVVGEQPNPYPALNAAAGLLCVVVLLLSFLCLGFFMYREDHRSGNIKRRMPLYDRFLR